MLKPLAAVTSPQVCCDSKHGNFSKERAFREYPHPTVETLEEGSVGGTSLGEGLGVSKQVLKAYGDKMSV